MLFKIVGQNNKVYYHDTFTINYHHSYSVHMNKEYPEEIHLP